MANLTSGDVVANNIKIHYYRTGGDKPPLILSHGITDSGRCWPRVMEALQQDYDLIMPDARGHGLSDILEQGYIVEDRAADLAAFIQALKLDKPYLMGHSMGADTTAFTAATYPALVGCAILEDPPWREDFVTPEAREDRVKEWGVRIHERKSKTLEEIIAAGRELNPNWDEAEFSPWAEAKHRVSPNVISAVAALRPSWHELFAKITCPVLLITGDVELGGLVSPEVVADIQNKWPHVKVAHIAGAGHNIRRDKFDRYIETVTAFLKEVGEV